VKVRDPLIVFLYLLARDHLCVGAIDACIVPCEQITPESKDVYYLSSEELGRWAVVTAERLRASDGTFFQAAHIP
jgi:hypothetical protein